jgi:predicted esterase
MEKKLLDFRFQAPFYQEGIINERTKKVWLIFHGYGQLANDFANSFSELVSDESVLLFPQGLSKFYLKGVSKKIGSNWMTSNNRDLDIENYVSYLDQLFDLEVRPYLTNIDLNILGFSQGGHTASRWIYKSKIAYQKLVLWGSNLANEIDEKIISDSFTNGENLLVMGDSDRFIEKEQLQILKTNYAQLGFKYRIIEYHGGHDIYPEILKLLV